MAGSANNWFKPAAGPLKGQSVYLSKAQQLSLTGSGATLAGRRLFIMRGLTGQMQSTAPAQQIANTQLPAGVAKKAPPPPPPPPAPAPAPAGTQYAMGAQVTYQQNLRQGGGSASGTVVAVHGSQPLALVHNPANTAKPYSLVDTTTGKALGASANLPTAQRYMNVTAANMPKAATPQAASPTPAAAPTPQAAPAPTAPAAAPAAGATVTRYVPGAAVQYGAAGPGSITRVQSGYALVKLNNGNYGVLLPNGQTQGPAGGYANASAGRQAWQRAIATNAGQPGPAGAQVAPTAAPAPRTAPAAPAPAPTPAAAAQAPQPRLGAPGQAPPSLTVGQQVTFGRSGTPGTVAAVGNGLAVVHVGTGATPYSVVDTRTGKTLSMHPTAQSALPQLQIGTTPAAPAPVQYRQVTQSDITSMQSRLAPSLKAGDRQAIQNYSDTPWYQAVNQSLRGQPITNPYFGAPSQAQATAQRIIRGLDRAFASPDARVTQPITAYRRIRASGDANNTFKSYYQQVLAEFNTWKPGDLKRDTGYMSTTVDRRIATGTHPNQLASGSRGFNDGILLTVRVPAGTKAIAPAAAGYSSQYNNWTAELLMARGTTYRVISVDHAKREAEIEIIP